jgi:hypothetical protein
MDQLVNGRVQVGVVLDKATNTQRFYFEHGDDITW